MAEQNDVVAPVTPEPVVVVEKGAKTPEPNLYAALEEERRLRKESELRAKEAEAALAHKEVAVQAEDIYSDEGKVLKNQIGQLESKLDSIQRERELDGIYAAYPVLKDKASEFEEFQKDYPRHKLVNTAKIFLAERDLLGQSQPRMGLERPTAGPKDTQPSGMSVEDVSNLRSTNYRKYLELLQTGKLNPSDIK